MLPPKPPAEDDPKLLPDARAIEARCRPPAGSSPSLLILVCPPCAAAAAAAPTAAPSVPAAFPVKGLPSGPSSTAALAPIPRPPSPAPKALPRTEKEFMAPCRAETSASPASNMVPSCAALSSALANWTLPRAKFMVLSSGKIPPEVSTSLKERTRASWAAGLLVA